MSFDKINIRLRFCNHINIPFDATNNECWLWKGASKNGYGVIWQDGKHKYAHQVSYLLYKGDINDKCVCHTCDNPLCINPNHLSLGSHQENMMDMVRKGRKLKGEKSPKCRFSFEQIQSVRQDFKAGISARNLASKLGCTTRFIYHVVNKKARIDC